MKEKVIGGMFTVSFILTGCGVDSIFESGESLATWSVAALVTIICGFILLGTRNGD